MISHKRFSYFLKEVLIHSLIILSSTLTKFQMRKASDFSNPKLTVCIVGGGNSAHVLIPFLSTAGHAVNLCTRRPNEWDDVVTCDLTTMEKTVTKSFTGTCKRSSDPCEVVPDADAIILCMPVHQYRNALGRIAPHINKTKKASEY